MSIVFSAAVLVARLAALSAVCIGSAPPLCWTVRCCDAGRFEQQHSSHVLTGEDRGYLRHRHAARVAHPQAQKTGNFAEETEAETQYEQFKDIVNHCSRDASHIGPLHGVLMKRLKSQSAADQNDCFATVTTLSKLDSEFVLSYIVKKSDLTMEDCIKMLKFDGDSAGNLLMLDQQIPGTTRLPKDMIVTSVTENTLERRSAEAGDRLAHIKAKGALMDSGRLDWTEIGCYSLEFRDRRLAYLKHRSGTRVAIPQDINIAQDWKLMDNWGDFVAAVTKPPLPPYKLSIFFNSDQKEGPWAVPALPPRRLAEMAKSFHNEWAALQQTKANEGAQIEAAASALQQLSKDKKTESLKRAREVAQVAMAKRKLKRTHSLGEPRQAQE